MARYFKVVEVDQATFVDATGEDLGFYTQSTIPAGREIFVAVDDYCENEIYISLDCFDGDGEG